MDPSHAAAPSADRPPAGDDPGQAVADRLRSRILDRRAVIGIIGLGYVGLPLVQAIGGRDFAVIGFDVDQAKIDRLNAGQSYIRHIPPEILRPLIECGRFRPTADFALLAEVDAVLICVPTPLTRHRDPDLGFVEQTTRTIARHLRPGQLVVLESTTYPGTTREVMKPILEATGLRSETDFFLAYSPEREDPGNRDFATAGIPKVVGGDGPRALALAAALYDQVVPRTVPVSSTDTAEAVKLTENIFRAVNIALVNELKIVFDAMGIDVWEVIEAAKSKPFGFMPFYPGPGLGGHCIPIDPFYLTWKAREHDLWTRFIELAGEVNTAMPGYVVDRLARALDRTAGRGLTGARILIVGVAYKKNVDDVRESPALRIMKLLTERGAAVEYHDPHVAELPVTREYPQFAGQCSVPADAAGLAAFDAVVICTDHDEIDYRALVEAARLVVDTRNACRRHGIASTRVVGA